MKFIKKLLCTHDYRLKFTLEVTTEEGLKRLKVEECEKCKKVKKKFI